VVLRLAAAPARAARHAVGQLCIATYRTRISLVSVNFIMK
jgi:hypothetical protein